MKNAAACCVPQGLLVVLLLFDIKYFDAENLKFSVPIYPWPVYLKAVLSVVSYCIIGALPC